ncbi:MAG: rRNA maturation RNase YbeY [Chloroflexi bacterium]|nr:rRNA maturation RNase YbeY [Chloroflexota bacterium]RJR13648.1 MAG: rRNA maturation RNase YbeY [Candidatus Parcubacteria bacterium]
MIEITVSPYNVIEFDHALINHRAQQVFSLLHLQEQVVTLHICTDEEIQTLNKQYRNMDSITDVLSFNLDYFDPQLEKYYLGDIAISLPEAHFQAQQHRQSLEDEITFLLIHGLLHLKGYDHADVDQEERMFSLQDNIFSQVMENNE